MGDKMIHLIQFMEKDGMKKREWYFFDTLNVGSVCGWHHVKLHKWTTLSDEFLFEIIVCKAALSSCQFYFNYSLDDLAFGNVY